MSYDTQGEHYNSLLISLVSFGRYSTSVTLTCKDHWPHDLNDLAERHITFYNDNSFFACEGKSVAESRVPVLYNS